MWTELGIAVAAAALASAIACALLVRVGPLDLPDAARKPHTRPTPTSGGLGIALGFLAAGTALFLLPDWRATLIAQGLPLLSAFVLFAFAFLLLGFVDDTMALNSRLKFGIFAVAALVAAWRIGVVNHLPLTEQINLHLPLALGLVGTGLWIFTLVNSVNFMDGANGLAIGSVAIGLGALGLIAMTHGSPAGAAICFAAVGAMVGFLLWNFPSGRLFAGDAGALFVGAIAALASLFIIRRTGLSPFIPPILFLPLLADVLLTLLYRVRRKRRLLEGHAEHHFHIGQRAKLGHARVALLYWAAALVCGAVGVATSRVTDPRWAWIGLAALALAAIVISSAVRRYAAKRGIAEG